MKMIDFSLTEEQKALQTKARDFAISEIIPVARKYDESGEFPQPVFEKAFSQGLFDITIPEAYGGAGKGKGSSHRDKLHSGQRRNG